MISNWKFNFSMQSNRYFVSSVSTLYFVIFRHNFSATKKIIIKNEWKGVGLNIPSILIYDEIKFLYEYNICSNSGDPPEKYMHLR